MDILYRINRLFMILAMLLYVPLTLAVSAALLLGTYLLIMGVIGWLPKIHATPRGMGVILLFVVFISISAAFAALLLLLGLFKLFTRLRSEPAYGVLLSPQYNKPFFELLDRICKKLRVRPPEQCYLSPFSEMSISDRTVTMENGRVRKNVRTLVVGAGLLIHIRIDELTTILCHEMAHAKAGDTKMCWWACRFNYALASSIYAQAEEESESEGNTAVNTAVRIGLTAYYYLFGLMYAADERWRELRADRMAAKLCGPQNLRNALIKTHLAIYLPELSIESLLWEYCQAECSMDDLYQEYQRRWEQLPSDSIAKAENQMFIDRHSLYDSHPCLTTRIRGISRIEAKEVRGDKPATRLFSNWERLAAMMTEVLMRRGRFLHRGYMAQILAGR